MATASMTDVMDAMSIIMAESPRMVIGEQGSGATRVPVKIMQVKGGQKEKVLDDDFELVDNEVGLFLSFYCHGDPEVRRFLYLRSIIDSETFAPAEHEWVIEFNEGKSTKTVAFRGRLYNYEEHTISWGKIIEMAGRIRVAD